MRPLALALLLFSCTFVSACSDDTSGGGGTPINGDTSDALADGTLGTDDTLSTDTIGGCMCETGYQCVAGDGGYTCVAAADGSADSAPDAPATGLTCTQVGACVEDACIANPSPCGLTCAAGASADTLGKIDALSQCVATKCQNGLCKGKITTKCMNECTGSQCGTHLLNCFEDNLPGGNTCNSALTCFSACDAAGAKGHFTCMSKCYTALSATAKLQLKGYTDCAAGTAGGIDAFKQCQKEYSVCATGGASGSGSCVDIDKCVANCPSSGTTCTGDCMALGSAQAQGQFNDMNACFASATDQSTCLGKLEVCATPSGTGKCMGVQQCTDACKKAFVGGDDKGSCTIGCLHDASKSSADAFIAFFGCVIPNCPICMSGDAACNLCLQTKCQKELTGCTSN